MFRTLPELGGRPGAAGGRARDARPRVRGALGLRVAALRERALRAILRCRRHVSGLISVT